MVLCRADIPYARALFVSPAGAAAAEGAEASHGREGVTSTSVRDPSPASPSSEGEQSAKAKERGHIPFELRNLSGASFPLAFDGGWEGVPGYGYGVGSGAGAGGEGEGYDVFLDLFDAFLGVEATSLPPSAGAGELQQQQQVGANGVAGLSASSSASDFFTPPGRPGAGTSRSGAQLQAPLPPSELSQPVGAADGRRRITAVARVFHEESRTHIIAVASTDVAHNQLAFCTCDAVAGAGAGAGERAPVQWHAVPWKKGGIHTIVGLSFNETGSELLVCEAKSLHVMRMEAHLNILLGNLMNAAASPAATALTADQSGAPASHQNSSGATWSWAQVDVGEGGKTPPRSRASSRTGRRPRGASVKDQAIWCLLKNAPSKLVACLCWKRSGDGAEVACAVSRSGSCFMFDLKSKAQLCECLLDADAEREIAVSPVRRVTHIRGHHYQSLLMCSSPGGGGPFFSLLLECQDPAGSLGGFEALPEAAILREFQVQVLPGDHFGTRQGGRERSGAQLSVHRVNRTAMVACHDTVSNVLELYDVDRPEDPVFVHHVPPLTLHVRITDTLIFAVHGPHRVTLEEEGRHGSGGSDNGGRDGDPGDGDGDGDGAGEGAGAAAEGQAEEACDDAKEAAEGGQECGSGANGSGSGGTAVMSTASSSGGIFNTASWYGIEDLRLLPYTAESEYNSRYFVSVISRFIADPERGKSAKPMNLVLQQMAFPGELVKPLGLLGMELDAAPFSEFEFAGASPTKSPARDAGGNGGGGAGQGAFDGGEGDRKNTLVLWTGASCFLCTLSDNPERLFHRLLRRPAPEQGQGKAELVALALRLDILRLYKQAAASALRRRDFALARRYFNLAGLSSRDVSRELLVAQCPARALEAMGGAEREDPAERDKARVLKHAAIAMELMQSLAGMGASTASDAAAAAAAAIADWARCDSSSASTAAEGLGGGRNPEKAFRLMVSAAILAGIVYQSSDPALRMDSPAIGHDFEHMMREMMKTGAVSNLPFVKEEDLVNLLTRDITQDADSVPGSPAKALALADQERNLAAEAGGGDPHTPEAARARSAMAAIMAAGPGLESPALAPDSAARSARRSRGRAASASKKLGSCERTVSALLAMQAASADDEERSLLQSDLQRILKENVSSLDKAWALPACIAWNNIDAAEQLLHAENLSSLATVCWLATAEGAALRSDLTRRLLATMEGGQSGREALATWQRIKQAKKKAASVRRLVLNPADLRKKHAIFSCGHAFTEEEFAASLDKLGRKSRLLARCYEGTRFPLGCPNCVREIIGSFQMFKPTGL